MKKFKNYVNQNGQLLVELILVMGLVAIMIPALLTAFSASKEGKAQQVQRTQATALLKETEVAVKSMKNNDWTTFAVNGTFYPSVSGTTWTLVSGTSPAVNGFTRSILISDVQRNSSGAIVSSGGTVDPSTKKVLITINWSQPRSTSLTSTMYVARTDNLTYTDSTQTQFNSGTKTSSVVLATVPSGTPDDGQVQLGAGGGSQSDWCAPALSITPLDLPKNGVANAITAIEGRVFAGTGDNASGVSFANVDITNAHPPVASQLGTFDGYKTNGVFGDANYAYLATDKNTKEIEIVNLASTPYTEAGSFDAPGNGSGNSVFVTSTYGYMTSGTTFYNFNKVGSSSTLDANGVSLGSGATGNKIYVVGNYAYVAVSGTTNQLKIIDLSNPSNLTVVSSFSVAGQSGVDVYVNPSGTRAYLATAVSASQKEMFIINVTTKTAPSLVSSYEANGMSPKGVTVVTNNKAILVGTGGEEYQVINVANEATPTRCGGLNIDSGVNGVSSVLEADGDAFSYIITGDSSSELKIIEGGAGASFSSSGTYVSPVYNATASVSFNRFVATVSQPSSTTVRMRVAAAAASSGVCPTLESSYTFVGPNGSSSTYFTPTGSSIEGAIPFGSYSPSYINPSQCFRYKVWLDTSDTTQTPVLYDVILNRSP